MALDVYVGTMTRFYRREWENAAQRMARESSFPYKMIYATGAPAPPAPADEIRQAVRGWSQFIGRSLAPHGFGPVEWDEGDNQPYFTERPAWVGYTALLVWASYADHPGMTLPLSVPDAWVDDPAFLASTAREFKTGFRTILEPQLWLPTDFPFVFEAPTLETGDNRRIGSAFTLKKQLDQLRIFTAAKLAGESQLAKTADAAIASFSRLAEKSCEHRLPILLNF